MLSPVLLDEAVVEIVCFSSGSLTLEGRLSYPANCTSYGAVLIAGPHPLLGGDMRNNVVAGLTAGLACRGYTTLSFNYRGVGDSTGNPPDIASNLADFWETSHVAEEPAFGEDLQAAALFLRQIAGRETPVALVGYSFGCSILPGAVGGTDAPLVLIAPTIGTHGYDDFVGLDNPMLVIAAEGDFATDADGLNHWFSQLSGPKYLQRGKWDDHFFRGHEEWLAETVSDFLDAYRGQLG